MDIDTVLGWRGRQVRDRDGEKLGKAGDVFLDRETDRPAWIGVRTGLFGRNESYVPLDGVEEGEHGDLVVPYEGELVRDAPNVDPDVALTAEEEEALHAHYGRAYERRIGLEENEVVRSEEEVRVTGTTEPRPTERVRLRKVLVTGEEQRTVPVRKEVVQLEHEPPPEGRIEAVEDVGPDEGRRA